MQRLQLALIGCGGMAGAHVRGLAEIESALVCSVASTTSSTVSRVNLQVNTGSPCKGRKKLITWKHLIIGGIS